jgi:large subunit ribosomal protein L15
MIQLNTLQPLVKKRKRVGRGGSRGGTAGRGSKGQNARSGGGTRPGFEGGQMPLHRRLPKRGFNNTIFQAESYTVDIKRVAEAFETGAKIDRQALIEKGLVRPKKSKGPYTVKVLGNQLDKKLVIHADAFSKSAQKAIVDAGGEAHISKEI